jgi:hypothetical protein
VKILQVAAPYKYISEARLEKATALRLIGLDCIDEFSDKQLSSATQPRIRYWELFFFFFFRFFFAQAKLINTA